MEALATLAGVRGQRTYDRLMTRPWGTADAEMPNWSEGDTLIFQNIAKLILATPLAHHFHQAKPLLILIKPIEWKVFFLAVSITDILMFFHEHLTITAWLFQRTHRRLTHD